MFATVNVLGDEASYDFAPGHTKSVQELQAALAFRGFPARLAGRLPKRHAFVRSFRKWLTSLNGSEVNHSQSEYVEHITTDTKAKRSKKHGNTPGILTFQVDRANVSNGGVTYSPYCTVTLDKGSGQVTGSDATIAAIIASDLPTAREHKKKADLTRLLRRVERHMIGNAVGTCPFGNNFFVPAPQRPMLDRLLELVADIGGKVKLRQEVVSYLAAAAPSPGGQPAPTPPVPASVSQAISDKLYDKVSDAERLVHELNTTKWASNKRRENKAAECRDAIRAFLADLNQYHTWLSTQKEIFNDQILAVERQLTTPDAPPPPAPVKVEYVNDPDDDISVIEVVSTPIVLNTQDDDNMAPDDDEARVGGGMGSRLCLFW